MCNIQCTFVNAKTSNLCVDVKNQFKVCLKYIDCLIHFFNIHIMIYGSLLFLLDRQGSHMLIFIFRLKEKEKKTPTFL